VKTLNFYGRTIKIDDISFCEQRKTRLYNFFDIVGAIIGWIIIIGFGIILYKSNMTGEEIFKAIFVFLLVLGGIGFVIDFLFGGKSIVVITLSNGNKIKSPRLADDDAQTLYRHISKSIER